VQPAILSPEPGPHTLVEVRWGGSRLAALRGADPTRRIGESWEFSTLPGRESHARGQRLDQLLGQALPFLGKLIDTARALSIQVHPDDDPVAQRPGKEEAWIVLAADPGAHVLCGVREGLDPEQFARAARSAAAGEGGDALCAALGRIPVAPGSVILVPAGTVHAIGGGILLAEIQQPSDCTHRLYDWGSGRELHVEQALGAAEISRRPQVWQLGETPRVLRGAHLELRILAPGSHALEPGGGAWLIVPVDGRAEIRCAQEQESVPPASLRLCVGGPLQIVVEEHGLAVAGRLPVT
jgi:mannose-6-phosphate isomerase